MEGWGGLGRTRFETSSVKSQTQKKAFISVFTKFLIILFLVKTQLMTAKMATIVRDVTGLQQCHHSAKYTSFPCKDQRLSTEGKIVSKYCNISKTLGREGSINYHPPPHSCATVRVCICVYVRGLSITDKTKIANITFSTPLLILPIISFLFVLIISSLCVYIFFYCFSFLLNVYYYLFYCHS